MKINTCCLGYREVDRLSNLMHSIAIRGVPGGVALEFGYDLKNDCAWCLTDSGVLITSDNLVEYGYTDYDV